MNDLTASLAKVFGFNEFRGGQEQTIGQLLNGQSSLAIFPTGSGKSLCYQLAAINLPHLTLVVSPLLALMKDQLAFLRSKGIPAASIDSTLSFEQSQQTIRDVRSGHIKILMVSVERFKNERFRQFIESVPVSMLVVDEAHCISEWGHNFRPDYLKLPSYQKALKIPLVLLLTATATKKVKLDMASKFAIEPEHIVQTGFYRNNLDLSVIPVSSTEKNQQLLTLLSQHQGSGIVYVTLQHTAELVAQHLQQQGVNACAYHAGFKDEQRQQIQHDFMNGKIDIVVATIAFGMGIDKADIRYVIHYDLPKSIENYSQEIGRAGRDGQPSFCYTLANLDGITTVENFVYGDTPELASIEFVLDNIRSEVMQSRWELQVLALSNSSDIKQLPLKTLLVQLELRGVVEPLFSYFADFKFKFITPLAEILALFSGERSTFLQQIFTSAKMKKVWGEPDFEALFHQHQAERSRVIAALEYLAEQQHIVLETKKATEVYEINGALLQDPSLAQSLHDYFADKEQAEIKRIAQLIRFFQLERCLSSNLSRYFDDQLAPQQCGHCSVCRQQIAHLSYSQPWLMPNDEKIKQAITALQTHFNTSIKVDSPNASRHEGILTISLDSYCRFLSGMTTPMFGKAKIRKLETFGLCEGRRYLEIKKAVVDCLDTTRCR
jgi:ATP-dependent DNA helicase RecQ